VFVDADGLQHGFLYLIIGIGDFHAIDLGRIKKALQVAIEQPHRWPADRIIGADALEDAGAIMEGMAHHVNLGFVPGDELAIEPDLVRFVNGHDTSP
jgi:hypothetical protein